MPRGRQREKGEEEETKVGAQGQRRKRRWTDGKKSSGPNFCRRPEGSQKTKVGVGGLMYEGRAH
jgi:hypothetical protein